MEGNRKSVIIHCAKTGIHVDGANNIGSTSDTIVSCKRSFLRVCTSWWNDYCGRDEEDEPVRNCDVGSAEEQSKRFEEYCESEACKRRRCKSRAKALCIERCALEWAQMPYVEKEGDSDGK